MLTVITARAGDGKTGTVTDLIGKRMAQGLPSVLIVPDQITYAAERRLCKELDIEGFSLCRVMLLRGGAAFRGAALPAPFKRFRAHDAAGARHSYKQKRADRLPHRMQKKRLCSKDGAYACAA